MRITVRKCDLPWLIMLGLILTVLISVGIILAPSPGCHATQPVYSSGGQDIGTWDVTIPAGQSVTLPDGDTAACTAKDVLIIR